MAMPFNGMLFMKPVCGSHYANMTWILSTETKTKNFNSTRIAQRKHGFGGLCWKNPTRLLAFEVLNSEAIQITFTTNPEFELTTVCADHLWISSPPDD